MEHAPHRAALTSRQLLVLQLLARGYSRPQIAALLEAREEDVTQVERRAGRALGAATTAAAVAIARRLCLIL